MILIAQDMFETFEIPWVFNREAAMKNEKKTIEKLSMYRYILDKC